MAGTEPAPGSLLAVTASESGSVTLLDRASLQPVRTVAPPTATASAVPMLVAEDAPRRVFYVTNFGGGLGRIPASAGAPSVLDLGGARSGLAISPDGRTLAVNGARDLTLRLVDLDAWRVAASASFGDAADAPLHSHMTHGLASTHPIW
ncbi:MAG TPA: hypothetical protein VHF22_09450, partial [Planctomycetota bacterium]|nr:hypothetical protein [Planctomycetota bacterium]